LGLLEPGNAGKILYTGPAENLTGASENSHVNGMFYTQATGTLFFPVGADGIGYAPAWLENGNASEVAVSVVASPAGFTFDPATSELQFLDNSRYWHVVGDLANINARVSLGLNGINVGNELTPVVVQSDNIGGIADNLQGLGESERVTSRQAISKSLVAIGGSKEVLLVIHDLITPFSEGHNDVLKIQNIKHFGTNKVTLLDRWGAPVKQWINFTNYDDAEAPNQDGYDFKQLSPGSYICIVEYGDAETGMRKKSQMISVLKAK
ncbi:MAG TPA: gliding motility-associated C-terminal domain-containing protein, partial [Ohtaekwangia sp.]|nr:gliding motility-associated C-terminal domain-containing protein [Ohtaekwangia sp.]